MARELTRPIRLAYQSFGQVSGMDAYQAKLADVVHAAVSADAKIDVLRLDQATVSGKGFGSAQALEVPNLLRSLKRAADAGYEAIAIGNGFDPGLWEARELFAVPVLGLFETVAFYALRAGWRFGVLCSGKSGVTRVEEMATRYGIAGRMVRPVSVGITVPDVMAAFSDPAAAGRILESVESLTDALQSRGAEVVVVASGALDVFVSSQKSLGSALPVLPSVKVLVGELEAAARLARSGVPFVSRAGRFAMPPHEVLKAIEEG